MLSAHSSTVVREVVESTERGEQYARGLASVLSVVRRIRRTIMEWNGAGVGTVAQLCTDYQSFLSDWEHVVYSVGVTTEAPQDYAQPPATNRADTCPICYRRTDEAPSQRPASIGTTQFLGHTYHAQCGNFYLNRVGTVLPQLRLDKSVK